MLDWAGWIALPTGEIRGSMPTPARTSLGVSLDLSTGKAQIPGAGAITPGLLNRTNTSLGFSGCFPGQICN